MSGFLRVEGARIKSENMGSFMKTKIIATLTVIALSSIFAFAAFADELAGKWNLTAEAQGQSIYITVDIKQTGETFTGSTTSDMGNGTIDGGKVTGKTFTATLHADVQGNLVDFKMDRTIDGDKITGTFANAAFGSIPFSATRSK